MSSKTHRRLIVVMLAIFMAINFADKAVIGLAAGHIMHDLHLQPETFGLVGSSFFLLFSATALIIGFVANHVRSYIIILVLALVWAFAQLPVAFGASLPLLFASRILLGAGEGPAFPMALHATFTWFHDKERNIPAVIVQQGVNVGLMASGPILTFIMVRYSWHAAFLCLAIVGLAWAFIWAVIGGDGKAGDTQSASEHAGPPPVRTFRLLTDPTSIALILVYFMEYAMVALYFTWLPSYLHSGLGYSEIETGWLFAVVSAAWIPANLLLAWFTNTLMTAGVSSRIARGAVCGSAAALGGIIFMSLDSGLFSAEIKVILVGVGGMLSQTIFFYGPLLLGEIAPENKRGGAFGILSAIGTLGGIVAPYAMGHIVQTSTGSAAQGFEHGYLFVGIFLVLAGVVGVAFINPQRSRARFARLRCQIASKSEPVFASDSDPVGS